jgi:hypothetical protein
MTPAAIVENTVGETSVGALGTAPLTTIRWAPSKLLVVTMSMAGALREKSWT